MVDVRCLVRPKTARRRSN